MVVGILTAEFYIGGADSLKAKRRVLKSLIERMRSKYNIAIAEVASQDIWQRATIGVTCVSSSARHANSILSSVINDLDKDGEAVLLDYSIEIV
ncbi:MAG TPA: DUF503 domain-containing protein [Firmicutes bacterium]|nr:DUF503 domain-containing protein [Bacillota bacterium]HHY98118.1 DUF503 domain-containing protein [Bacillota bacterium]